MNTKALTILALTCPILWGANMLAKRCSSTEANANAKSINTAWHGNDLFQQAAETEAASEPRTIIGVVVPAAIVDVRAQVNGVIDSLSNSVGDSVEASQAVATLDNADLVLEAQSQQARLAAAGHRALAAEIDLKMLQEQETHMQTAQNSNAASAFEVNQLRRQVESAAAKLKGLSEDCKEQQVAARKIDHRMSKYRCLAPIAGRIIEIDEAKGAFVQEGQLIARIQSARQHINVNLPADLVEQLQSTAFCLQHHAATINLMAIEVAPNCNLDGSRCIHLAIPARCDLVVGQTLHIRVSTKP